MRKIKIISEKYGVHFVTFDRSDFELINQYQWHIEKKKTTFYAASGWRENGKMVHIRMHRLLLGLHKGSKKICDHRDGNGLNNCRKNLRTCTYSQNNANMKSRKGSSSSFLGVSWCNREKKWRATIQKNKKYKSLGQFDNELEAAKTYNTHAKIIHGEFAKLNNV